MSEVICFCFLALCVIVLIYERVVHLFSIVE